MGSKVLVALFITSVLGDEVEVLATDNDGTMHLGGDDGAGKDTTTDRDQSSEWALLVNIVTFNGILGRPEAQTNVLVPSLSTSTLCLCSSLMVLEDVRLLLISALTLDCEFGSHVFDCEITAF